MYSYDSLEEEVARPLSYWPISMAPAETGMCGEKRPPYKEAASTSSRSRSRAACSARGNRTYAACDTRPKRPRSSPDRILCSLQKRTPSPSSPSLPPSSVSTAPNIFHPMLFNNSVNVVAFYSPKPPTAPMYLMSLSPYAVPVSAKSKKTTDQPKTDVNVCKQSKGAKKKSLKIVRHVTRSLFRAVEKTVAARAKSLETAPALPCDPAVSTTSAEGISSCKASIAFNEVASQTSQNIATVRQLAESNADDLSISSEDQCAEGRSTCEWAGDVRALRDSHVRLVLRQLQQLRDIERLDRTLRRARISSPLQNADAHASLTAKRADSSRTSYGCARSA